MAKEPKPDFVVPPDQIDDLCSLLLQVEDWAKSFRAFLVEQLNAGVKLEAAYLGDGNTLRGWKEDGDPEDLRKAIQQTLSKHKLPATIDTVAPRVTLSPPALEKAIGKTQFRFAFAETDLVETRVGNPILRIKPQ